MFFLFSGEGPGDFGTGRLHDHISERDDYNYGPMAFVVEQIVKERHEYSILGYECCGFLSEEDLSPQVKPLKPVKKHKRLPGRKGPKETGFFFNNARALAIWAKEEKDKRNDDVVAVLFRDCDDPASFGRGEWPDKWKSMMDGFKEESFERGVPMLPQPTSEAWLLCALKCNYENCGVLEARSPSPRAGNPLKAELSNILNGKTSREDLCSLLQDGRIDALRIKMPSFDAFRKKLLEVI